MSKRNIIIVSIISLTVLGALGIWLSNKYTGEGVKNIDSFSFFGTSGEESGGLTGGNGVNGRGQAGLTAKPANRLCRSLEKFPHRQQPAFMFSIKLFKEKISLNLTPYF